MVRRIAAVVATLGLALTACSGSSSSANDAPRVPGLESERVVGEVDTVVMIGDSITVASRSALQDEFEQLGFANIVIKSQDSKRTASGSQSNASGVAIAESLVEPDVAHSNEVWVVALGTNDINQYDGVDRLAGAINEMLSVVPAEAALIWVDTYARDLTDGAEQVNAVITARIEQRDNAAVARWSDVAAEDGNLRTDGLHPRDQGSIVFASTIGDSIVELLDR